MDSRDFPVSAKCAAYRILEIAAFIPAYRASILQLFHKFSFMIIVVKDMVPERRFNEE